MTYLRLVPVASRRSAGSSGFAGREPERLGLDPREGRRRVGEIRFEPDDAAGGLQGADPVRAATGGDRGRAERRWRDHVECRLEPVHRRRDRG